MECWRIFRLQWRFVLLCYHRFWQNSVQRGRHTQVCIINYPQAYMDYPKLFNILGLLLGFKKKNPLTPTHITVWGNFPFDKIPLSLQLWMVLAPEEGKQEFTLYQISYCSTVRAPVFGTLNSAISNFQPDLSELWWKY